MKKLITLSNLTTGTTVNVKTGKVRKVGARPFSKKQIESIAKNIAEVHNAGVNNLLKKEEEKSGKHLRKILFLIQLQLSKGRSKEKKDTIKGKQLNFM